MIKRNPPNIKSVAEKSISLLLQSMLDTEDDRPLAAEHKMASAIMLLNQLADIAKFDSPDMNEQFIYCRDMFKS